MISAFKILPYIECAKLPSVRAAVRSEDDRAPLGVRVFCISPR